AIAGLAPRVTKTINPTAASDKKLIGWRRQDRRISTSCKLRQTLVATDCPCGEQRSAISDATNNFQTLRRMHIRVKYVERVHAAVKVSNECYPAVLLVSSNRERSNRCGSQPTRTRP